MRAERRCTQRTKPVGISYFEFEAGSGGIVLDASEKGLAFQAADAVHQLGPSRIFISPHPEERIEVNGEVVWVDKSKKTGGLRFIEPGADSRNRIRDWLKQPGQSEDSRRDEEFPLPRWAVQDPVASRRVEVREERTVMPRATPVVPPLLSPDFTWTEQDPPRARGHFANGIATAFLIVVFLLVPVALYENFGFWGKLRPKVGDSLIRLGEKLNGSAGAPSQNPPLQTSISVPAQNASSAKPAETPSPAASQAESTENHGSLSSSSQNNPQTQSPVSLATKEMADHSPYSGRSRFTQERSTQATSLWSAVGAGDSAAEVDLAQLYLRGEGVPRNCEQARILLRAAAKGGNREARRQLQKLRTSGCR